MPYLEYLTKHQHILSKNMRLKITVKGKKENRSVIC